MWLSFGFHTLVVTQLAPYVLQAYVSIAEQCWLEDPAARPTFSQLVLQLQQLLQQEDALQDEVEAVYGDVVGGWQSGGNSSEGAAGAEGEEEQPQQL
jgi:hypothetical protein